jgi:hypothetical protein
MNADVHCWKACWQGKLRHVRFRRPRHTGPASPERFGDLLAQAARDSGLAETIMSPLGQLYSGDTGGG